MTILTSHDWMAIMIHTADDLVGRIKDGAMELPIHIVITGGNDEPFADFVIKDIRNPHEGPDTLDNRPKDVSFPVTYTATDIKGRTVEAMFSEDAVRNLRKVS